MVYSLLDDIAMESMCLFIESDNSFFEAKPAFGRQSTTISRPTNACFLNLNASLTALLIRFLKTAFLTIFLAIAKPSFALLSGFLLTKTVSKSSDTRFARLNTAEYSLAVFSRSFFKNVLLICCYLSG